MPLPSVTKRVLIVFLVFLSISTALHFARYPTVLSDSVTWLRHGKTTVDSWEPMLNAEALASRRDTTIYDELFFHRQVKFIYPPSSLLLITGTSKFSRSPINFLNNIGWLCILLSALSVAALCVLLARRTGIAGSGRDVVVLGFLVALMTVTFYPVVKGYTLGQLQTYINALFALTCLAWALGNRVAAGISVGLICLMKPQFGLFLLWGLLRGEWAFVAGWAGLVASGLTVSILNYGLANHFAYLRVLQFLSHRGEAYYPNQSVNGLLNRWYGHTDSLLWDIHRYPSLPAKIYAVTIVISAILILLAFVVRPRAKSTEESLLDFIRAALAFTMASPIAWEHHYGILPPLLVTLMFFGLRMSAGTGRKAYLSVLGGAYITSASYFAFANHFAGSRLNFLQSYLFFAALALLVLAYVPELKRFRLSGQGQEDGSYKPHEVSHAAV